MMLGDRIRAIMKGLVDQYADGAVDPLPAEIVRGRRLIAFGEAIKAVHFPTANANLEDLNRGRTPAHHRFAFEDFFLLELALGQKRESVEREARSVAYDQETLLPRRFLDSLPFRLTEAQSRVLQDIRRDLAGPHPMNRLIQGDVGCGKTVVATAAMLMAVGSGLQAALMAPTEILAEQHYLNLHRLLEPLGVSCVLLVGGRGKKREAALAAIADGVFPLVEESEKVDLQAAITGAERLQREVFAKWTVGLIHGRMKAEQKDRVMADFKAGRIQVLVATTVIEVGIDVSNATVMLIEHADRFGLAQLHQLRGRVGRGAHQSYCFLMGPQRLSEEARRRLEALVKSHDGFVIAEEDLRIRGPGEFFGTRQWGPSDLRVANLIRDAKILEEAREEATRVLQQDPDLARPEHGELKAVLLRRWQQKLELAAVS